tara:strand:+ start:916 stop:1119 length:204 start_codon:yes stop_codon:yes gene_type:complete
MDNYISNDPNNPINQQPKTQFCEVCNIEENKTYFVEDYEICEDCFYSCCGDELNQDVRICPTCKEHN